MDPKEVLVIVSVKSPEDCACLKSQMEWFISIVRTTSTKNVKPYAEVEYLFNLINTWALKRIPTKERASLSTLEGLLPS